MAIIRHIYFACKVNNIPGIFKLLIEARISCIDLTDEFDFAIGMEFNKGVQLTTQFTPYLRLNLYIARMATQIINDLCFFPTKDSCFYFLGGATFCEY